MTTQVISYETLVEQRKELKDKMSIALSKNDDKAFCIAYTEYKSIDEHIKEIDAYWNSHD